MYKLNYKMGLPIKNLAEDQSLPTCRFIDLLDIHIGNQGTVSSLLKHDLLSSSRGLHLLAATVPLMKEDDIIEKGTALIALCLKVCKKHVYSETDAAIAYDVLGKLLERCRDLPNVEVILTTQAILELIQQCLPRTSHIEILPSLICLHVLVKRYIKRVIAHRANIEKYLIQFLDSDDLPSVMVAAKIANLLQQIRLPGESGLPKAAWREQLERLCKSAQDIINQLYSGATDFYINNYFENFTSDAPLNYRGHLTVALENLAHITSADRKEVTAVARIVVLVTRLNNVMLFIQTMLIERFPGVKAVRPHPVLECVIRLLGVNVANQSTSVDVATLAVLSSSVRMRALNTLDALIHCLGTNLMPYSALILRLAFQNLRWSQEHYQSGNAVKNVRAKAYSTISFWMMTLKSYQFVKPTGDGPDQEQELVNWIKYDIAEKKATFELMITSNPRKNMSKRAMRKLVNSQLAKSTLASHAPGAKHTEERWNSLGNKVTQEALNCLRVLLYSCGIFLKTSTYHQISSFLLPICLELHLSEVSMETEPAYRLSLYQCVEALQKGCKPSVAPPMQYCLHLYALGIQDRDNKVSAFCNHALMSMRSSLHGVPPTLSFGLQTLQEKIHNVVPDVSQRAMSEQNRIALTSLLGRERIEAIQGDDVDDVSRQNHNISGLDINSTYSNNEAAAQKRKQSEGSQKEIFKWRRLSVINPTLVDLPIPATPAISITSSDEETQLVERPLEEYERIQNKDTAMDDVNDAAGSVTIPGPPPVQNITSEGETIYIDDDSEKPLTAVELLSSPRESNCFGDLDISCAQSARSHSREESEKTLLINAHEAYIQAIEENNSESEIMNANLSVDEMMADFVDAVVA